MTEAEIKEFIASNPAILEHHVCVLYKLESVGWVLGIGETHSDGVFRHTDARLEENYVRPMLSNLYLSSPEGRNEIEFDLAEAEKIES